MNLPLSVLHAASSRFESARHVDVLPEGHPARRMHGHGFVTTAYAAVPADWVEFPGGELQALQTRVDRATDLLSYRTLNEVVAQPTDENLARWLWGRLDSAGLARVAVQSTPDQGVEVDRRDHAHVWRRYRFQAAHQLPNVPTGHKCGRLHGHGFQVIVHANQDLAGADLSVDYAYLDRLWAPLNEQLNYRCLNDLPGLENPTSENLSAWIWHRIKPGLPALSWISVYETASCGSTFDGRNYRIWKDVTIDSALRHSRAPQGNPLRAIHGHTYTLRLHLTAPLDQFMGWTVDFGDVKTLFDPILKSLDHHPLHEKSELADCDTTTIASWLITAARVELPQLSRVDLFESEGRGSLVGEDLTGPALPV